eukprot:361808-Chlamydomonas_euryale.AAC.25
MDLTTISPQAAMRSCASARHGFDPACRLLVRHKCYAIQSGHTCVAKNATIPAAMSTRQGIHAMCVHGLGPSQVGHAHSPRRASTDLQHGVLLALLHGANFVRQRGPSAVLFTRVPVHVLVLLPPPCQRLHAVPQVELAIFVALNVVPRKLRIGSAMPSERSRQARARHGSSNSSCSNIVRRSSLQFLTWSRPPRAPPRGGPLYRLMDTFGPASMTHASPQLEFARNSVSDLPRHLLHAVHSASASPMPTHARTPTACVPHVSCVSR